MPKIEMPAGKRSRNHGTRRAGPQVSAEFDTPVAERDLQGEIARLAYQLWLSRGCPEGSPDEDWFHAEQELRGGRKPG
jgi:hypothetical protein